MSDGGARLSSSGIQSTAVGVRVGCRHGGRPGRVLSLQAHATNPGVHHDICMDGLTGYMSRGIFYNHQD